MIFILCILNKMHKKSINMDFAIDRLQILTTIQKRDGIAAIP